MINIFKCDINQQRAQAKEVSETYQSFGAINLEYHLLFTTSSYKNKTEIIVAKVSGNGGDCIC